MQFRYDFARKPLFTAALAGLLAILPVRPAAADDETDETETRVSAPLQAADCAATPPTITVLGQEIDISGARVRSRGGSGGCSSLVLGKTVKVRLASGAGPLKANRVDGDHSNGGGNGLSKVRIDAPIQAIDLNAMTVQVLGLTVDVRNADFEGADDSGRGMSSAGILKGGADDGTGHDANDPQGGGADDGTGHDANDPQGGGADDGTGHDANDPNAPDANDPNAPDANDPNSPAGTGIDISDLAVGQFVEIQLDPSVLPELAAAKLEVKNFTNGVEMEIHSSSGRTAASPIQLSVIDSVKVRDASGRLVTRRLRLATSGSGRIFLQGLPTGQAQIQVRRLSDGAKASTRTVIQPNRVRKFVVQLP
jgi:hypothetical protein